MLSEKVNQNQPGGSLAVFHKGELIFSGNYGSADLSTNKRIDKNSQFYIASVSKSFTSAAILFLWEENRINLDAKVSSILEGFENLKEVNVRQLLDHTSGVSDYYDFIDKESKSLSNNDVKEFAKTAILLFAPGTDYAYSNTAYILLAAIVKKLAKKPYEHFIHKIFLKPLKMHKTLVYDKDDKIISNKVIGYNTKDSVDDYKHFTYGAGCMYSTIDDFVQMV